MKNIPRLVIAATQSGSGKTTIVTGLLAALKQQGLKVQSFKVGPDYIDPGYHTLASGRKSHNLDTWLVPESLVPAIFAKECQDADIAVIEGVMGLFDGGNNGISSTAKIAKLLQAPVLLVIDAKSMGASAAAIALGFVQYDPEVNLAGVILNRLGSDSHEKMIREAMAQIGIKVYGAWRRDEMLHLPERHLGLVPTKENDAGKAIYKMGQMAEQSMQLSAIMKLAKGVELLPKLASLNISALADVRIGIAYDEAFSFYYPTSLEVLKMLGAKLIKFSPIHDASLPAVDGIIIGGGFPEMFAPQLADNESMHKALKQKIMQGMPVYAECGGYMYLLNSLIDFKGIEYPMTGVFAGRAVMTKKLQTVGYVKAVTNKITVLGEAGLSLKGHEFHFSVEEAADISQLVRPLQFTKLRNGQHYEAGQCYKRALGSYLHLHFAGNIDAAKNFVQNCAIFKQETEVKS